MSEPDFSQFLQVNPDAVPKFRAGDVLKFRVLFEGDILESSSDQRTLVEVKKSFFLKKEYDQLMLSWDGHDYQTAQEALTGSISAGAGGSSSATDMLLMFSLYLRP